ncbi:MAG TPA: T9SS type A sorting domain-containing protein, partial [Bacteroidia bacterium]|nr:T9SS type A sorting domain-containing protein [Bacteroidia bacterium]
AGRSNRTFLGGGKEDETINSITQRSDGMMAFTGVNNSYGLGKGDVYFATIHPDFTFNNSTTFGSGNKDVGNSISCTADKGFIICGTTNGFRNFLDDIYLVKTDSLGFSTSSEKVILTNILETPVNGPNFTVYPNPATDVVMIHVSDVLQGKPTITICDLAGRILKQDAILPTVQGTIVFPLGILSDGLYLITIATDKSSFSRPLVVKHD